MYLVTPFVVFISVLTGFDYLFILPPLHFMCLFYVFFFITVVGNTYNVCQTLEVGGDKNLFECIFPCCRKIFGFIFAVLYYDKHKP